MDGELNEALKDAENLKEDAEVIRKNEADKLGMPMFQFNSDEIFTKIEAGDHKGVEKLLAEQGHKVKITPKIGCPSIHYSKFNLANFENSNQDTPLIKAAYIDAEMVRLVLAYGGNPNHTNKDRHTPLSIAAEEGDQEMINLLLHAGANLRVAVVKLTSSLQYISEQQMKEALTTGFSVRPLMVLLSKNVYLKCRDPIKMAFDVGKDINRIRNVRDEFKSEFELLMRDADLFTYKFLNHCDKMFEAREILTYPDNLLQIAINRRKKTFVSHPFSQQIINEQWFGELAHTLIFGQTKLILWYLTSPIMLPILLFKYLVFDLCRDIPFMESGFTVLMRFIFTPCLSFTTDAINYILFLTVVILTCVLEFATGTFHVTAMEYLLFYCVLCRIFIEVDHFVQQGARKYFRNFWNYVDVTVIGLLVSGAIYKVMTMYLYTVGSVTVDAEQNLTAYMEWLTPHHQNSMNAKYIYAIAEFILVVRIMSLFEISKKLGTMLIALRYLVTDVIRFSIILLIIIMGTSIAIYSMTIGLLEWNHEVEFFLKGFDWPEDYPKELNITEAPSEFENLEKTIRSILFSTFGLLDVVSIKVEGDQATTDFIMIVLILYVLLSCVLLLNMLIGILSSTFNQVKENCDIEWKYARSQLLKEYSRAQPLLFPFFPLCFPFIIWLRMKLKEEKMKSLEEQHTKSKAELTIRDQLISIVCDRFTYGTFMEEEDEENGESFEMRMKSRKIRSVMLQIAVKVKKAKSRG